MLGGREGGRKSVPTRDLKAVILVMLIIVIPISMITTWYSAKAHFNKCCDNFLPTF